MNRTAPREEHRALSLGLALAMHGLIAALLYFGVQWRTHPAAPVEVELWAGVPQSSPAPVPVAKPTPKPAVEPEAAPEPEVVKPEIQIEKAKPAPKPKPEPVKPPPKPEPPKKIEPKKPELTPLKQPPKTEPGRNKVLSELAGKLDKPPLDASVALAALAARQSAAEAAGKANAMEAYYGRVRNLIRRNMNYPDDPNGNPEAEFSVTLLPSMAVLSVELTKSSGVPAFDEAVKRAILRAEQYPQLPPGVDFSSIRKHKLKYRQHDG